MRPRTRSEILCDTGSYCGAKFLLLFAGGWRLLRVMPEVTDYELPPPRAAKTPRAGYLLILDLGMLALACVLEALSLTGLAWHEWLGFLLCVLVLFHVILQWSWFVVAFRRLLTPGARRARVNLALNFLLFIVMVAVLVSGVLISNQIAPLVGQALGRPRVWSELHSWLNFTLIVLIGLHLAINWDWVLGAIRRRTVQLVRLPGVPRFLFRGAIVLLAAGIVAASAYATMGAMLKPTLAEKAVAKQMAGESQKSPVRKGRAQSFRNGMQELDIAALIIMFVAVVGRYVLRIHL